MQEGQGLGKKEQGISMALQVEKTSKRGGRIIHEREMMPPPIPSVNTPPHPAPALQDEKEAEPSITEIMKRPSKVVLLRVNTLVYQAWFGRIARIGDELLL